MMMDDGCAAIAGAWVKLVADIGKPIVRLIAIPTGLLAVSINGTVARFTKLEDGVITTIDSNLPAGYAAGVFYANGWYMAALEKKSTDLATWVSLPLNEIPEGVNSAQFCGLFFGRYVFSTTNENESTLYSTTDFLAWATNKPFDNGSPDYSSEFYIPPWSENPTYMMYSRRYYGLPNPSYSKVGIMSTTDGINWTVHEAYSIADFVNVTGKRLDICDEKVIFQYDDGVSQYNKIKILENGVWSDDIEVSVNLRDAIQGKLFYQNGEYVLFEAYNSTANCMIYKGTTLQNLEMIAIGYNQTFENSFDLPIEYNGKIYGRGYESTNLIVSGG